MKLRKWVKVTIGAITGVIAVSAVGYIGINMYVDSLISNVNQTEEIKYEDAKIATSVSEQTKDRNVVNIAMFGTDHDADESDSASERADANKIISLDFDNKQIKITSVQRDNLIYIPDPIDDFDKLNHAYWYGGPQLSIKTLNANLDLDITKYVSFSFSSVEKIVDLLGGVDIYLNNAELSVTGKYSLGINGSAGTYHLNGHQALVYCRTRSVDSDYQRIERQNAVISAIVSTLKSKSVFELMGLVDDVLPLIETNLTASEIKDYVTSCLSFDLNNIQQFKVPANEYEDVKIRSYKGYSPLYLLRSYSEEVINVHKNIYGDDDYQPSEQLLEIEKNIYDAFGPWE